MASSKASHIRVSQSPGFQVSRVSPSLQVSPPCHPAQGKARLLIIRREIIRPASIRGETIRGAIMRHAIMSKETARGIIISRLIISNLAFSWADPGAWERLAGWQRLAGRRLGDPDMTRLR